MFFNLSFFVTQHLDSVVTSYGVVVVLCVCFDFVCLVLAGTLFTTMLFLAIGLLVLDPQEDVSISHPLSLSASHQRLFFNFGFESIVNDTSASIGPSYSRDSSRDSSRDLSSVETFAYVHLYEISS
jgi:hypothetical protein